MSIEAAVLSIQKSQQSMAQDVGELTGLVKGMHEKLDAHIAASDATDDDHTNRIVSLEGTRSKAKGFMLAAGVPGIGGAIAAKWDALTHWLGMGN